MAIELTKEEARWLSRALYDVTVIPDKFIPLALWACTQQLNNIYGPEGDISTSSGTLALMMKFHEHAKALKETKSG